MKGQMYIWEINQSQAVSKLQAGLNNADNTPDVNKLVSTAQQTLLNTKADKTGGKDLSPNDFTNSPKTAYDTHMGKSNPMK